MPERGLQRSRFTRFGASIEFFRRRFHGGDSSVEVLQGLSILCLGTEGARLGDGVALRARYGLTVLAKPIGVRIRTR